MSFKILLLKLKSLIFLLCVPQLLQNVDSHCFKALNYIVLHLVIGAVVAFFCAFVPLYPITLAHFVTKLKHLQQRVLN